MTLNGAIKQLQDLQSAEDIPIYYKPCIKEVINVLLMDTKEVRHGHWVELPDYDYQCSECGIYIGGGNIPKEMKYCPHCGAKMGES